MFKIGLLLALTIVSLAFANKEEHEVFRWDKIPEAGNNTQCIYRADLKEMSCRRSDISTIIDCPAILDIPEMAGSVDALGIALKSSMNESSEVISFHLYPRRIDTKTYMNNRIDIDNRTVEFCLFYSEENGVEKHSMTGIRISDLECYIRLAVLIREGGVRSVQVGEKETRNVELLGEILVADKPNNKRYLGGLWAWNLGYGWGFPGWGLPIW